MSRALLVGLVAVATIATAACTPSPKPARALPSAPALSASAASSAVLHPPAGPNDLAAASVSRVLRTMAKLRALRVLSGVRGASITRTTMIAQLKDNVRKEVPPEAMRGQGDFLRAFGWIPAEFDFEQGLYGLLENQLAGYYDPDQKAMFLMDDLSSKEADATLAHELVHALQDQHYNLAARMKYRPEANDEQSAFQCLAEGDATSAMLDFLLENDDKNALDVPDFALELQITGAMALSAELTKFPSILRRSLVVPYVDGVRFVHALRRRGGWQAVDDAWRNLPATTEQILHLDKFDVREPQEPVAAPRIDALGPGWKVTYVDIWGEQGLRLGLEEWMPSKLAVRAAQGWAGDHAVVAAKHTNRGEELAAAWRIRFDPGVPPLARNSDASEAFRSIADSFDPKRATSAFACKVLPDGTALAVLARDRDVVLIGGNGLADTGTSLSPCDSANRWGTSILSSQ